MSQGSLKNLASQEARSLAQRKRLLGIWPAGEVACSGSTTRGSQRMTFMRSSSSG